MKRCGAALLVVAFASLTNGQTFDAASVKPGGTEFIRGVSLQMKGGPGTSDPGRIAYTQQRLRFIVMKAWDLKFDQLAGPSWITDTAGSDSYTITAAMPPDTTKEQFQLMLQNLSLIASG